MSQFRERLTAFGVGFVALILLSGCVNTHIAITYTPQANVAPIPGAARVPVNVDVKDLRLTKAVADYAASGEYSESELTFFVTNDVAAVVKQAVEDELANRGFKHSENGVAVRIGLKKLYAHTRGTIILLIQVRQPDGTIVYSKSLTATAKGVLGSRSVVTSLNRAFQNEIAELFADRSFIDAIFKASGSSENSG
jgi:uncharacterized lipoprotein YajG